MKGFKAFKRDMTCNGFQYEENKEFKFDGEPKICKQGFHFCEDPLDVLNYYDLTDSEFAEVEATGKIKKNDDDSKRVTNKIKIGAKLGLAGFVKASVNFMIERAPKASSGDESQLASSGDGSKLASSGYESKLASSGDESQLASSGDGSKLASSGDWSQLASSGYRSKLASSGDRSKLASSGDRSKLASSGESSVLMNAGIEGKAKGKIGNWISLSEWKNINGKYVPVCVKCAQIDGKILKEDTYYQLAGGEFTEAK